MSWNPPLLDSSIVVASKNQISSELSGEAVILHLTSGLYYGLNPVGARIWFLIQEPQTIGGIRATLLSEYEVEPDTCDADLRAVLQDLLAQELVEVRNEAVV